MAADRSATPSSNQRRAQAAVTRTSPIPERAAQSLDPASPGPPVAAKVAAVTQ